MLKNCGIGFLIVCVFKKVWTNLHKADIIILRDEIHKRGGTIG